MREEPNAKPVVWIASTKHDLKSFPDEIQGRIGHALWSAQIGGNHPHAKVLKGFGDAGVETPRADIDLVKRRLRDAKAIHEALRSREKSDG